MSTREEMTAYLALRGWLPGRVHAGDKLGGIVYELQNADGNSCAYSNYYKRTYTFRRAEFTARDNWTEAKWDDIPNEQLAAFCKEVELS